MAFTRIITNGALFMLPIQIALAIQTTLSIIPDFTRYAAVEKSENKHSCKRKMRSANVIVREGMPKMCVNLPRRSFCGLWAFKTNPAWIRNGSLREAFLATPMVPP